MGVVGAAIKGFGKALKVGKRNKASKQAFSEARGWGAHLKRRSRVFKEGQDRMKGLKVAKRNKESKKLFEKSKARSLQKQIESGVVDRNVKSKDVFKIIKGLKK